MSRKYSVEEIDRMRRAISRGRFFGDGAYRPAERTEQIESLLRTYMLNGTTPLELEAERQKQLQAEIDRHYDTVIHHIDGNPLNNDPANLRVVSVAK